jgi:CheY-like chemotaxis protein
VVKQNGGEILVYSEPGQGTVFKIYLPAITSEAKPLAVEAELPPAAATETILLVEDEDQVRRLTRTMLASKGYQVLQAANPAEAFQILGEHQGAIDLVLTDIVMPGMNGVELATRVRDVYPEVRVLFMSGYTDNKVLNQGILAEGAAFLQKPFTSGVLNRKVREVLNG